MVTAWCRRCSNNQEMIVGKEEIKNTKTGKKKILYGKCKECGNNIARIEGLKSNYAKNLPNGVIVHKPNEIPYTNKPESMIPSQSIPNYPQSQNLTEIDQKIRELQAQKAEKERVLKYMEEVKKNPVLNSHGIGIFDNNEQKVIKRSIYTLLKVLLVLFGVAIIVLFFMGYKGYFKDNNTCNPTNVVECKEQICNVTSLCEGTICESQVCNVTSICNFPSVINVIVNNTNNTI